MTQPVPPGWYPTDPSQPWLLRYWDGAGWTQHVHDQRRPNPTAAGPQAGDSARGQAEPGPVSSRRRALRPLAAVGVVVLIIGAIASAMAGRSPVEPAAAPAPSSTTAMSKPVTTTGSKPTATKSRSASPTKSAKPEPAWPPKGWALYEDDMAYRWLKPSSFSCSYSGARCWGIQLIPLTGCPAMLYVEISLLDGGGNVIGFTNATAGAVGPGQKAKLVLDTYNDNARQGQLSQISCY
jgi:hypothetical protein